MLETSRNKQDSTGSFLKDTAKDLKVKTKKCRAFSLIELSIIITVIGILISGVMALASFSINFDKVKLLNNNLDTIYQAIGSFVTKNGRLPCPAPLDLSKDEDLNYGTESYSEGTGCISGTGVFQSSATPKLFYGAVPIKTLGIGIDYGEDAYGTKLSYVVDQRFATASDIIPDFVNKPSFGAVDIIATTNILQIRKRDFSATDSVIEPGAIFVIISHGPDKEGGYPSSSRLRYPTPNDTAENENYYGAYQSSSDTYKFNSVIFATSESSGNFDDYVFYKTRAQLVSDYNLNYLIACNGANITDSNYPKVSAFFNQKVYSLSLCTGTTRKSYIRCGAGGLWDAVVAC